ncbi:MAG: chitobiase/beta-hexosaminidase C-terminal domain-containing protein, partial [candidate division Zixibacteria bacterium]|nr:chitobiase/beta-hexosaminidase C-terminal domain-containing protein [candidate division Zixibacteria bacterium]
ETLLKASFTMTAPNDSITYDIGLGTIRRGINYPKLYEVPAQQWADMTSEGGDYGVAVLNDCKYGWDHPDKKTLRLSLIHTPGISPGWEWVADQRSQDIGWHRVTFAVTGHKGDWRDGAVAWQAARLNQPLLAFQTTSHPGKLDKSFSLLTVTGAASNDNPAVMVTAVKFAEDGNDLIVRLRELTGKPLNDVQIHCATPISAAKEMNGVEQFQRELTVTDDVVAVSFTSYQPKTLALTLDNKLTSVTPPVCKSVTLPYNLDGISLDDNRTDGDFDGLGNTLAGELMPDTLVYENIPFVFGPKNAGANNIVACKGQEIRLPQGSFNRLYLLVAAVGGPKHVYFVNYDITTMGWVPDYAEPIGQWNNRVTSDTIIEEADLIAPSYINHDPAIWYGSHRHTPAGENEAYRFTYLYLFRIDLPSGAETVTLADNADIRIAAATVVSTAQDNVHAAQSLFDVTNATVTKIYADQNSFLDETTVRLACPVPGAEIHYTLGGSEPTRHSLLYEKPFTLTKSATVKACSFKDGADNHHVAEADFIKLAPHPAVTAANVEPGLLCYYFEGAWQDVPDFEAIRYQQETLMVSVSIPPFAQKEGYGLMFKGFVRVPTDGVYTFFVNSDDGSELYIGDTLLADNGGVHGEQEMSGRIALRAGLHPIMVYMFQGTGDQALTASIQGPGMKKQIIPPEMLFHAPASSAMK